MSTQRGRYRGARHADWLRLIDVSGPFIGVGVLAETFPQGLDADEPRAAALLREGYAAWEVNRRLRHPDRAVHRAWTMLVLENFLEYHDGLLAEGPAIPETMKATLPEHRITLRPDFAVGRSGERPTLLVSVFASGIGLQRPKDERGFHASPAERMRLLLRGAGVGSGLLTNGDQWMLVHQPADRTATFATWESDVLIEESEARRAFRSLLGARRLLGVAPADTLDGLFERSRDDEREVTDQLGTQARRAVELLVDAIDRADREADGALLIEQPLERVYEAVVSVMMRVVFLLAAEARGLMPEDGLWLESYAVTPIREQLRTVSDRDGEELLDRRFDAWPRVLATFRAVHGGVEHARIRLPGYGGGLFDPERYPFLEGIDETRLRISNRVMLHFLDALQTLEVEVPGGRERRPLSFRALGVEQIGYVYEGLLDHEAVRAFEPAVGLVGTSKKEPEIALSLLEQARGQGDGALLKLLKDETGRSASALRRSLEAEPDATRVVRLRAACDNDEQLVERILPYLSLVRDNTFGSPTVYLPETVYVTASTRRRSTGTHYTPPSLTEPIVRYALEPVVYHGPAEGLKREDWTLKPPAELIALKVCDIAMGSGAFLVAACRYLAARLVEAWDNHPGEFPDGMGSDPEERELTARRLVAERCLYGVDMNPLAVDIAKVSLWLITLRRDRPFTFVDHALRPGDSLLGLVSEQQLLNLSIRPEDTHSGWMLDVPRQIVHAVLTRVRDLRERIESSDAIDLREVEQKLALLSEAERAKMSLDRIADLVAGAALAAAPAGDSDAPRALVEERAVEIATALRDDGRPEGDSALIDVAERASQYLDAGRVAMQPALYPFHWVLEFPEVFAREDAGFDAIVGNPPYLGGRKISGALGKPYRDYLVDNVANAQRGSADLAAYFLLRATRLLRKYGAVGLVTTNTVGQGDTREIGLDVLCAEGWSIYRAVPVQEWPGEAGIHVAYVWLWSTGWLGPVVLNDVPTEQITPGLDKASRVTGKPYSLLSNARLSHYGCLINGDGFLVTSADAQKMIQQEPKNTAVLFPYLIAQDLASRPDQSCSRWVINFHDWSLEKAEEYEDCMRIVRERVFPHRTQVRRKVYREKWWLFAERQETMQKSIANLQRVLVGPQTAKWWAVTFVPNGWVYSHATTVFAADDAPHAAVLSSVFHEGWMHKYSGSLRQFPRYSPTDCFENFPFPASLDALAEIGDRYLSHRKATMLEQDEGLTTIYNRVNEHPEDQHPAIVKIRGFRRELDRAVANAYGWTDLELDHDFRETSLGLRYTIGEQTKTEALDRLLELNHERHAEEVSRGLHANKVKRTRGTRKQTAKPATSMERLFIDD